MCLRSEGLPLTRLKRAVFGRASILPLFLSRFPALPCGDGRKGRENGIARRMQGPTESGSQAVYASVFFTA